MIRSLALTIGVAALIGTGVWFSAGGADSSNSVPALGKVEVESGRPGLSRSYAALVDKTIPAVVSVYTTRMVRQRAMPSLPFDFGFPDLFGRDRSQPGMGPQPGTGREREGDSPGFRQSGLGSGVIVTADGTLLTNHHVVDGASEIKVRLHDRRTFDAQVTGSDPRSDLAVLSIDAHGLPVLPLGNSSNVQVGDVVLAIGNPFGVGETVTQGIVGAKGRGGLNPDSYEDFVQTDAAINPGNSGGALINTDGQLIGVNTAIISRGGGNQGVGFAVPVNMAYFVMKELITHGKVSRGYVGVGIQDLDSELAKAFQSGDTNGALITKVEPGSPGEKAGLQQGDIVKKVNGEAVDDSRALRARIGSLSPGQNVDLAVVRSGKPMDVPVQLGTLPDDVDSGPGTGPAAEREGLTGVEVTSLTPNIASQAGVPPGTTGVVVSRVDPASGAFAAGLRGGDVITEVGRKPVSSVADFRKAVAQSDGTVLLLISRRGASLFLAVSK